MMLDFFKRKKKKVEKAKKIEKPKKREIKKALKVKVEEEPKVGAIQELPTKPKRIRKKKFDDAYRILKEPHITEKATDLTAQNQYSFNVFSRANKIEIKKAVESLYNVDVTDVKIIKVPPKKRRIGRIEGQRKGYKKAIVKIKDGQKIEVLPR